jgi:hypothetical protein
MARGEPQKDDDKSALTQDNRARTCGFRAIPLEELFQFQRVMKKRSIEVLLHPWIDSGLIRLGVRLSALSLI